MSIADTPRGQTWEALRKTGEVRASETLKHDALEWIRDNPVAFSALALRKAAYFWSPPFHDGKGPQSTAETGARLVWSAQFVLLAGAALSSLLLRRPRQTELIILWAALLGYWGVHMLFYVIFRYREPIMPLVAILAALTIERGLPHRASVSQDSPALS